MQKKDGKKKGKKKQTNKQVNVKQINQCHSITIDRQ